MSDVLTLAAEHRPELTWPADTAHAGILSIWTTDDLRPREIRVNRLATGLTTRAATRAWLNTFGLAVEYPDGRTTVFPLPALIRVEWKPTMPPGWPMREDADAPV